MTDEGNGTAGSRATGHGIDVAPWERGACRGEVEREEPHGQH